MKPGATALTLAPERKHQTLEHGSTNGNPATRRSGEAVAERDDVSSVVQLETQTDGAVAQKGTQSMASGEASEQDTTVKAIDECIGSSPGVAATILGATTGCSPVQVDHGGIQDDRMPLFMSGGATGMPDGDKATSMNDADAVGVDFADDEDSMGGEWVNPS
jgi:hypothetical protein